MDIFRRIAETFYPQIFDLCETYREKNEYLKKLNEESNNNITKTTLNLTKEINNLKKTSEEYQMIIDELNSNIKDYEKSKLTEIETFCEKNFKEIPKFAYKNKRFVKDKGFTVYPNEMIQPNSFLVEKERKMLGVVNTNRKAWALKIGKRVDSLVKWTDELQLWNKVDLYSTPSETITLRKEDCEQHAFLVSSIEPEIASAFGKCGTTYHAFNVFVYENILYILETNNVRDNNNNTKILEYSKQDIYQIDYIFTKDRTYKISTKNIHYGEVDKL